MSIQLEIAKTVAQQIGSRRLGALGATKKTALRKQDGVLGGLQFSASLFGKKNCQVIVQLKPSDTYTVMLLKPRAYMPLCEASDIYCEELGQLVESMVEEFFAGNLEARLDGQP